MGSNRLKREEKPFAHFLPIFLQTGPKTYIQILEVFASVWSGSLLVGDVFHAQGRIQDASEAHYQARTGAPDLDKNYDLGLDHLIDDIKNGKIKL